MSNEKVKPCLCPNCQKPAIKDGNEIICEHCDATYEIRQKQGARVKKLGALEDLTKRVEKLEASIFEEESDKDKEPKQDDEEEPILPE